MKVILLGRSGHGCLH
uniref:Uncharacterized protein n=1 Tax=Rhizophora mucronata TaxID=61149 RepID=A0A2P2N4D4_RHIMU